MPGGLLLPGGLFTHPIPGAGWFIPTLSAGLFIVPGGLLKNHPAHPASKNHPAHE